MLGWIKRRLGLNKDKTRIYVEFHAFGDDLVPDVFTNTIGIEPTIIWIKGQPIRHQRPPIAKDNSWQLSTDKKAESLDLKIQLKQIYDLLLCKTEVLKELKRKFSLNYRFDVVIKIENQEQPGMFFPRWFLSFVDAIEAEIDIDFYCFS